MPAKFSGGISSCPRSLQEIQVQADKIYPLTNGISSRAAVVLVLRGACQKERAWIGLDNEGRLILPHGPHLVSTDSQA